MRYPDKKFDNMSLKEIRCYADEHPAEGGRLAKAAGKTAGYCLTKFIDHQIDRAKSYATPKIPPEPERT